MYHTNPNRAFQSIKHKWENPSKWKISIPKSSANVDNASNYRPISLLLLIYCTCIRPHLEYVRQLWDPFSNKSIQSLKAVQIFACKVCLKWWDLDYDNMLQLFSLPHLSVHCEYLQCTLVVTCTFHLVSWSFNFTKPLAHTN